MIRRFALLFLWYFCSPSWTSTGNRNQSIFVYGRPYIILSSTRSKCFSIIAPRHQIVTFEFDAPDLASPSTGMFDAARKAQAKDLEGTPEANGMDTMFDQRMADRMERIKSKKLRDTSITVSQKRTSISTIQNSTQSTRYDAAGTFVISGSGRIREELTVKKGRVEFLTGKDAGTVEVCVQCILASNSKPVRFHLRADMDSSYESDDYFYDDDDDFYLDDDNGPRQKKAKPKDPDHLEHKELTTKMSRLERDLQTLQNRVKACLNNADYNKDQEAIFHEQSVSMKRASKYWPMIQLAVLLVTGFTQANHIVRYLKSHRIGI